MTDKWVAITGCNGYIGGQTVLHFKDQGYKIIGCDRNHALGPWLREYIDVPIPGDFTSGLFTTAVQSKDPEAVIHIAGSSLVGPSMADPAPYYVNNVGSTAKLIKSLVDKGWNKTVVFSSSAATYGNPVGVKIITEEIDKLPISPYGHSKLMAEQVIRDCALAYGFKAVALRYFNACGADSQVRHGQVKQATHVIARLMESLISNSVFTLNGQDYDTSDGTCVRDYLHVEDIARAHHDAMLIAKEFKDPFQEFNLGTGRGYSIREIIDAVEHITGRTVLVHTGPRREGDPDTLVASPQKFKNWSGWRAENSKIENIIRTSWQWYNSRRYQDHA